MITIKDIYQWYKNARINPPRRPDNLTPLQTIEWDEKNASKIKNHIDSIKNKSFVGEILIDAYAEIEKFLQKDLLNASGYYLHVASRTNEKVVNEIGRSTRDRQKNSQLIVLYEIHFGHLFYDRLRLLNEGTMIKFSGKITKFETYTEIVGTTFRTYDNPDEPIYRPFYSFSLTLSSFEVINKQRLFIDLLDEEEYHEYSRIKATSKRLEEKERHKGSIQVFLGLCIFGLVLLFVFGILIPWLRKLIGL